MNMPSTKLCAGMSSSTTQASTYAEIAYSIKELCTELEKFVASKSLAGAACGDWPALLVVVVLVLVVTAAV